MNDEPKNKPPYLPYSTFKNVIGNLNKNDMIPARIDRTVLVGMSGGMQSWVWAALRFLGLMDDSKTPTDDLKALVKAEGEERKKVWKDIFERAYGPIIGGLDLSTATLGMLQEKFSEQGLSTETARKCHSFYTAAAEDAGVNLPAHLKANARPSGTRTRRKKAAKVTGAPGLADVDEFGDPHDSNTNGGGSQKEASQTYTLPLDREGARTVKLKMPVSLSQAELERVKNWLSFQVIIDDPAEK